MYRFTRHTTHDRHHILLSCHNSYTDNLAAHARAWLVHPAPTHTRTHVFRKIEREYISEYSSYFSVDTLPFGNILRVTRNVVEYVVLQRFTTETFSDNRTLFALSMREATIRECMCGSHCQRQHRKVGQRLRISAQPERPWLWSNTVFAAGHFKHDKLCAIPLRNALLRWFFSYFSLDKLQICECSVDLRPTLPARR